MPGICTCTLYVHVCTYYINCIIHISSELINIRVPVIWSKFEFLNYQLEYELTIKITMKNGFRLILALTETRLHHFEV